MMPFNIILSSYPLLFTFFLARKVYIHVIHGQGLTWKLFESATYAIQVKYSKNVFYQFSSLIVI